MSPGPRINILGLPWHGSYAADAIPLTSGEAAEFAFELLPISMDFKAGHSIRLVMNFADARVTARLGPMPKVTKYRGSGHESYVTLPIVEAM